MDRRALEKQQAEARGCGVRGYAHGFREKNLRVFCWSQKEIFNDLSFSSVCLVFPFFEKITFRIAGLVFPNLR